MNLNYRESPYFDEDDYNSYKDLEYQDSEKKRRANEWMDRFRNIASQEFKKLHNIL